MVSKEFRKVVEEMVINTLKACGFSKKAAKNTAELIKIVDVPISDQELLEIYRKYLLSCFGDTLSEEEKLYLAIAFYWICTDAGKGSLEWGENVIVMMSGYFFQNMKNKVEIGNTVSGDYDMTPAEYMEKGLYHDELFPVAAIDGILTDTVDRKMQKKEIGMILDKIHKFDISQNPMSLGHTGYLLNHAPGYNTDEARCNLFAYGAKNATFKGMSALHFALKHVINCLKDEGAVYLPQIVEHALVTLYRYKFTVTMMPEEVKKSWGKDFGAKMKRAEEMLI